MYTITIKQKWIYLILGIFNVIIHYYILTSLFLGFAALLMYNIEGLANILIEVKPRLFGVNETSIVVNDAKSASFYQDYVLNILYSSFVPIIVFIFIMGSLKIIEKAPRLVKIEYVKKSDVEISSVVE